MLTEQMTSLLTSCHIQHVCLHYKSVHFIVTCHRQAGWYLTGKRGDMSPSLDFGVPLTGIDSVIPGWDAFNPPHWNKFCPSVSDMNPLHSNDGHKHNGAKS